MAKPKATANKAAAKRTIKDKKQELNELIELNSEERIELIEEDIKEVIDQIAEEQKIESYYEGLGNYDLLKAKAIRMFCSGLYTQRQIARSCRVTENTIRRWLADDKVKEVIEKIQRDEDIVMAAQLKSLRRIAIEKQLELIQYADNEMVSAMMIKDVLDRTGHKPVEKREVEHNITYEERLREIAQGIEVEYTVVDNEVGESHDIDNGTCAKDNIISTEGED